MCLGIEPLQVDAARFLLADLSSSSGSPSTAQSITWTDLSTILPVPEQEAIHDMKAAAARVAAIADDAPVAPPSDVRLCVTGSALAAMWDSDVYVVSAYTATVI